ncbi:B3 domain-containing protein Os01g0723500-like [Rosa rugosa]|uniref:B3 domain-containing protein Os01g0723500-like n=1 Tax=Rosa rugosa TaxID=74645 RepID=UPI002B40C4DD|nr:B3 domain-containing protein Os01g0723500-like [Rosa rugosa]
MATRTFENGVEEKKGPTFCTFLSPGISNEILKFPQNFQKHILNDLSELALLKIKDSSHCSWNIRVHQTGSCIYLKEGWREFLEDHSIGDGEFLIVRYDGRMQFSIQIFDKNHVERVDFPDTETHDKNRTFANNSELNGGEEDYQHYRARENAKQFKSKFPAVAITIGNSIYYAGFPTEWCRKYLPANNYKFLLRNAEDLEGRTWEVNGVPTNDRVMLSAGWAAFLRGNQVKKGDVCWLELESKSKMVAHIIRK